MKKILIVLFVLFLALMARVLYVLLPAAGAFQTLEPKLVEMCTPLEVFPGTEDIAINHSTNRAFVSGAKRRESELAGGGLAGGIFAVELDDPTVAIRVSPMDMPDFQPHGISLWHDTFGETRLFAINHLKSGDQTVEIFLVGDGGSLTHLESVTFDDMYSPNDLVAVGPRQFYVTNDRGKSTGFIYTLEQYLGLPLTNIAYFDGSDGKVVSKGLVAANGINKSLDGSNIYVSELLKRRIRTFTRNASTGVLERGKSFKVNTGPDNIDIDADGSLWVAGHSNVLDWLAHADDETEVSPSHVVRIDPKTGKTMDVLISIKGEINASSVGAVHNGVLLVGAVFDSHILLCPLQTADPKTD